LITVQNTNQETFYYLGSGMIYKIKNLEVEIYDELQNVQANGKRQISGLHAAGICELQYWHTAGYKSESDSGLHQSDSNV